MTEDQADQIPEVDEQTTPEDMKSNASKSAQKDSSEPKSQDKKPKSANKFARLWQAYVAKKKLTFPLTIIVLIIVILAVPTSRYPLIGTFMKQNISLSVVDSQTGNPISSAAIVLNGVRINTDNHGQATLKTKIGYVLMTINKKYYQTYSQKILVPIKRPKQALELKLIATGRQVPLFVTDKITNDGLENVTIAASGTEVKTEKDGTVTIVLPANQKQVSAILSADGYNQAHVSIQVTDHPVTQNQFKLVPTGKIYFLSKLSGNIDVVKTDLDGSNRQTVLAGTGNEEDTGTILLASRDWKYLALISRRNGTQTKVYLIDTASDKLTTIDGGSATFSAVGWSDDRFIYTADSTNTQYWQSGRSVLKSYDATTNQLTSLDQTTAEGVNATDYAYESFGQTYILDNTVLYTKNWNAYYTSGNRLNDKQAKIISVRPDGSNLSTLKTFGVPSGTNTSSIYIESRPYQAQSIYFKFTVTTASYFTYENGQIKDNTSLTDDSYYNNAYPTYLVSPSDKQTFWSEERDGKNTLFIGDITGNNGKQIASLSDYTPYGWFTDKYLLVSKSSSELYIMSTSNNATAYKVSDYHKPNYDFHGYGYGYGGL
jgi:hypothetical protein